MAESSRRELTIQKKEKGIISIDLLFPSDSESSIALWQGDITRLKVDAIANATNSKLLGCFVPEHRCIDNVIPEYFVSRPIKRLK